jgi:hypothetical protein
MKGFTVTSQDFIKQNMFGNVRVAFDSYCLNYLENRKLSSQRNSRC